MAERLVGTPPTIAACRCGQSYSINGWAGLPYVGAQHIEADATGPAYDLELRNCSCGSTIGIEIHSRQDTAGQFYSYIGGPR
jgi:hypothetical protein